MHNFKVDGNFCDSLDIEIQLIWVKLIYYINISFMCLLYFPDALKKSKKSGKEEKHVNIEEGEDRGFGPVVLCATL